MISSLQSNRSQQGFTLIELVVVIVILGILAVTAAPKFIDITSDARIATVEALGGALAGARDLSYAKSLVEGTGEYPTSADIGNKISFDGFTNAGGKFTVTGYTDTIGNCYAEYEADASATVEPTITVVTTSC